MRKSLFQTLIVTALSGSVAQAAITANTANSPLTGSPLSVAAGTTETFQITGLGSSSGASDNYRFGGSNDATGFLTADVTISTTGGDLTVSNNLQSGRVKGVGVTTGTGVTSITMTTTFDRYLHGLLTGSTSGQNPWLASLFATTPDGFAYDLSIEYSDIATILTNGMDDTIANSSNVAGLSPANGALSDHVVVYKTNLASASPMTTFSGSGQTQTITTTSGHTSGGDWIGLNSVRPNPPGSFPGSSTDFNSLSDPGELTDGLISRIQQVSARTVSFTITPNSGAFPEGVDFLTSMDGRQEIGIQEALAVPEPSASLLFILAAGTALVSRRRSS